MTVRRHSRSLSCCCPTFLQSDLMEKSASIMMPICPHCYHSRWRLTSIALLVVEPNLRIAWMEKAEPPIKEEGQWPGRGHTSGAYSRPCHIIGSCLFTGRRTQLKEESDTFSAEDYGYTIQETQFAVIARLRPDEDRISLAFRRRELARKSC